MTTTSVGGNSAVQAIYDSINAKETSASSKTNDAENRFLRLLTAQMKNQDPLNPLDNAQVTSQMAQISTVDGIERLNATLKALVDSSAGTQTLQAATMVGRQVLVPGSALTLARGVALGGVELAGGADNVTVTIKDAHGLTMRTLNLGDLKAGVHGFAWDGKTDGGVAAADGGYTFAIAADQGGKSVAATALAIGAVGGVSRSGQTFLLDVSGLGKFGMADVKEIL